MDPGWTVIGISRQLFMERSWSDQTSALCQAYASYGGGNITAIGLLSNNASMRDAQRIRQCVKIDRRPAIG